MKDEGDAPATINASGGQGMQVGTGNVQYNAWASKASLDPASLGELNAHAVLTRLESKNGLVYWRTEFGAHGVNGTIDTPHAAIDYRFGLPVRDEVTAPLSPYGTSGIRQDFSGGIAFSSEHGVFYVNADVCSTYNDEGGTAGWLGFPVGPLSARAGFPVSQPFEGGSVYQRKGESRTDPRGSLEDAGGIFVIRSILSCFKRDRQQRFSLWDFGASPKFSEWARGNDDARGIFRGFLGRENAEAKSRKTTSSAVLLLMWRFISQRNMGRDYRSGDFELLS